ncbi:acyl carrier protein [Parafrankia sp. FMc2]
MTGDDALTARLTRIWESALGLDDIKPPENFLDLGGDSATATRVIAGIRGEFGVALPLRALFDHPTVAELAEVVSAARPSVAAAGSVMEDVR